VREIRGDHLARGRRFAVAVSRFNELVTRALLDGALDAFRSHGVEEGDVVVAWVPGAFELPLLARRLAASGGYDAVICLGAVIRGETPHFDLVAGEAAAGIRSAAEDTGVPVIFGVLTTNTVDQAADRAGGKHGNKGWDAAMAAMETASVLERLPKREGAERRGGDEREGAERRVGDDREGAERRVGDEREGAQRRVGEEREGEP
jgi:6,7-dimethyl-8-ribityllumazine synthase